MSKEFQNHIFEHLLRKQAVQDLFMEEQDLVCQLQKLVEKMGGTIKFKSEKM